jgi:hypothetical protein
MNIQAMHSGIDVNLQELNSAIFNKLQHEEKDYILNDVIENLLRAAINKAENTIHNLVTYQDIREYYTVLQPFLKTLQLEHYDVFGELYTVGVLPADLNIVAFTSGVLYKGVKYKVRVAGATNLSTFGGTVVPVAGDVFECSLSNLSGNPPTTVAGNIYRILDPGDLNFMAVGALANTPGTVFTATGAVAAGTMSATIEQLASKPTWDGTTKLIPVYNKGYNNILSVNVYVDCGEVIASGTLEKNKRYRVVTSGTTNFKTVGGYEAISAENTIFTCTSNGAITWLNGTEVIEVKSFNARLVKMHDVGNFLSHSFGSVRTSPIAIIADGYIRVYHNNQFTIHQIYIDYVRKPLEVNYNEEVDCDMHSSLHSFIVSLAARKAAGISGSKEYEVLALETEEEKKSITK